MEKHFSLPIILLLDLVLAALVGTTISISSKHADDDTAVGLIACVLWYSFVWCASMNGFIFVAGSVLSASDRSWDARILAQDLLYALLWDIFTSLLMTDVMWALWAAIGL